MPSGDACQTRSLSNSVGFPDCSANLRMRLRPFLPSGPSCMVHRSQGATEEAHEHLGGEEGGGEGGVVPRWMAYRWMECCGLQICGLGFYGGLHDKTQKSQAVSFVFASCVGFT